MIYIGLGIILFSYLCLSLMLYTKTIKMPIPHQGAKYQPEIDDLVNPPTEDGESWL